MATAKIVMPLGNDMVAEYPLEAGTAFTIGRQEDNDIVIGEQYISRVHAEISFREGHFVLRGKSRKNAVKVNGVPVSEMRLVHGDRITICDVQLAFRQGAAVDQPLPAGWPLGTSSDGFVPLDADEQALARARRILVDRGRGKVSRRLSSQDLSQGRLDDSDEEERTLQMDLAEVRDVARGPAEELPWDLEDLEERAQDLNETWTFDSGDGGDVGESTEKRPAPAPSKAKGASGPWSDDGDDGAYVLADESAPAGAPAAKAALPVPAAKPPPPAKPAPTGKAPSATRPAAKSGPPAAAPNKSAAAPLDETTEAEKGLSGAAAVAYMGGAADAEGTDFIDMSAVLVKSGRQKRVDLADIKRMFGLNAGEGGGFKPTALILVPLVGLLGVVYLLSLTGGPQKPEAPQVIPVRLRAGENRVEEVRVFGDGLLNPLDEDGNLFHDDVVSVEQMLPGNKPAIFVVTGKKEGETAFDIRFDDGTVKTMSFKVEKEAPAVGGPMKRDEGLKVVRELLANCRKLEEEIKTVGKLDNYCHSFAAYKQALETLRRIPIDDVDAEYIAVKAEVQKGLKTSEERWNDVFEKERKRYNELYQNEARRAEAKKILQNLKSLITDPNDLRYLRVQVLLKYKFDG